MKRCWQIATILAFLSVGGMAVAAPEFSAYRVAAMFHGFSAPPDLSDRKLAPHQVELEAATKRLVDFAGRFHIATWPCGSTCVAGAAIDAVSGHVVALPFTICCYSGLRSLEWAGVLTHAGSRLIVFSGLRDGKGENGNHFYEFDGRRFRYITTIEQKPSKDAHGPPWEKECVSTPDNPYLQCFR